MVGHEKIGYWDCCPGGDGQMNTLPKRRAASEHGTSLIELLVYMALFVVVVGFATAAFFDCWSSTKILHRDADDIARALDIGERWRADVRGATGVVQSIVVNGSRNNCAFPPRRRRGSTYIFANGTKSAVGTVLTAPIHLWLSGRQIVTNANPMRAGRVAVHGAGELELKPARKEALVRPLFNI